MPKYVFDTEKDLDELDEIIETFVATFDPIEGKDLILLEDSRTGAIFTECHVSAEKILEHVLAGILRDAITARRDYDAAAEMLALEADMRTELVAGLGGDND